jgi:hypothetical protein
VWRQNLAAPCPEDPAEAYKLNEQIFAGVDALVKKGELVEFGFFPDGLSGYAISTGTVAAVRLVAELIPDARFELFEHSGHCLTVEDPARFNQLLHTFIESL